MTNTSSSGKAFNRRREIPAYAAVWLVALAARLVYLWQIRHAPVFTLFLGDGVSYDASGPPDCTGDWVGKGVFYYQAPLYPYFLGVVYALFGTNPVGRARDPDCYRRDILRAVGTGGTLFFPVARVFWRRSFSRFTQPRFFSIVRSRSRYWICFFVRLAGGNGSAVGADGVAWWAVAGIAGAACIDAGECARFLSHPVDLAFCRVAV